MEDPTGGPVGLCATCRWARVVRTPRSTFWMCRRSFDDPRFPKYPRLPILACVGYEHSDRAPDEAAPETP